MENPFKNMFRASETSETMQEKIEKIKKIKARIDTLENDLFENTQT